MRHSVDVELVKLAAGRNLIPKCYDQDYAAMTARELVLQSSDSWIKSNQSRRQITFCPPFFWLP